MNFAHQNRAAHFSLLAMLCLALPLTGSQKVSYRIPPPQWRRGVHRAYSTNFPLSEKPISENRVWRNGKSDGVDWSDVQSISGLAFGTQVLPTGPPYNDSVAVLDGDWNPNQMATARVHTINQQGFEEVELLLRMSITPHSTTGYEVTFHCDRGRWAYAAVGYWNGPLNDFGGLHSTTGPGLWDGDVVSARIVGSVITVWINGVQVLQCADPRNRFPTGSPGIGFYYHDSTGANADFGFTSFTASDES